MKILTVRQPWAWAIIHAGKDVENRTRNIAGSYRGPVAIHAGLATFEKGNLAATAHKMAHGGETDTRIVFGAVIGVVELVGIHHSSDPTHACHAARCSDWAETGAWHLELANPRQLRRPIPLRGALGMRNLPDEVATDVLSAIRGAR